MTVDAIVCPQNPEAQGFTSNRVTTPQQLLHTTTTDFLLYPLKKPIVIKYSLCYTEAMNHLDGNYFRPTGEIPEAAVQMMG